MSLDLYICIASPPSMAVEMTAKHLGLNLNLKVLDYDKEDHLKPAFLKINPLHTMPTLIDNGFTLWESRAIQTYLVNKYAPNSSLYPKDPQARALVDRVHNFDIGSLYPRINENFYEPFFGGLPHTQEKEDKFKKQLEVLETVYLGDKKYVTGDQVTVADLSLFGTFNFLEGFNYDISMYPNIVTWLKTLKTELPYQNEVNEKHIKAYKAYYEAAKAHKE